MKAARVTGGGGQEDLSKLIMDVTGGSNPGSVPSIGQELQRLKAEAERLRAASDLGRAKLPELTKKVGEAARKLEAQLKRDEAEANDLLAVERNGALRAINEKREQITKLRSTPEDATRVASRQKNDASLLQSRIGTLQKVQKKYPGAAKVNLEALVVLPRTPLEPRPIQQKLPALALIRHDNSESSFEFSWGPNLDFRFECSEPSAISAQTLETIAAMVRDNCFVEDPKYLCLTADFTDWGTIPKNSRKIIKEAVEGGLFQSVFLLTEVQKWDVHVAFNVTEGDGEYSTSEQQTLEISKGPSKVIVIGIVKADHGTVPVAIHAFKTKPASGAVEDSPK